MATIFFQMKVDFIRWAYIAYVASILKGRLSERYDAASPITSEIKRRYNGWQKCLKHLGINYPTFFKLESRRLRLFHAAEGPAYTVFTAAPSRGYSKHRMPSLGLSIQIDDNSSIDF